MKPRPAVGDFPFLFFGRRPGDWGPTDNWGHPYALWFERPLAAAERAVLGELYEDSFFDGPGASSGMRPFQLAGAEVRLAVEERPGWSAVDPDGYIDDLLDAAEGFFRAVADALPLVAVAHLQEVEPCRHPWTEWSRAQGERPALADPGELSVDDGLEVHRAARRRANDKSRDRLDPALGAALSIAAAVGVEEAAMMLADATGASTEAAEQRIRDALA